METQQNANCEVDFLIGLEIIKTLKLSIASSLNLIQNNHTDHTDGHTDSCHVDSGGYSDCGYHDHR